MPIALGLVLAPILSLGAGAAAEIRRVEAVGTAPVRPGAQVGPLRDGARDAALQEAVRRVARDQLDPSRTQALLATAPAPAPAAKGGPPGPQDAEARLDAVLDQALGTRALDYLNRFRILEDRGQRPALFSEEPGVEVEYVVVVEALVDTDRVLSRLQKAGLPVTALPSAELQRLRIELVDLADYRALAALQTVLAERLHLPGAVPVEMERGRAALELPSQRDASALLPRLVEAAAPELAIESLAVEPQRLVLRLSLQPPQQPPGASGNPAEIDTRNPNRY